MNARASGPMPRVSSSGLWGEIALRVNQAVLFVLDSLEGLGIDYLILGSMELLLPSSSFRGRGQ